MAELTGAAPPPYDEARIKDVLGGVSSPRRVAFACSMAERLMPTAEWLTTATNRDDADHLRALLDIAWGVAAGEQRSADEIENGRSTAESLVPDDEDDDWTLLSPLAQNAAAAVAYALRTCPAGDAQEATWAARQVHEAADYLEQLLEPDHTYREHADAEQGTGEPLSVALTGIAAALAAVDTAPLDQLRSDAATDGARFVRLLDASQ